MNDTNTIDAGPWFTQDPDKYEYAEQALVIALRDADDLLRNLLKSIPDDEQTKGRMLMEGQTKLGDSSFARLEPIEGSEQKRVVFSGDYTEALQGLNVRAIKVMDIPDDAEYVDVPLTDLTHWQAKRAHYIHFAKFCLLAANYILPKRQFGNALRYLCQAMQFIGAAGVPSYDRVEQAGMKKGKAAAPKKGGKTRSEHYAEMKAEAHRLAREKAPTGNGWPSMRQAAKAIKNDVQQFARSNGYTPLTEDAAQTRISEWLGEMPEKDTLFASKRATSTSKSSTPAS